MHLLTIAESYEKELKKLRSWISSRGEQYKKEGIGSPNSFFGIKIRKIEFYDIIFPKEWKERFLSDLKGFMKSGDRRFYKITNNFFIKKMLEKMKVQPFSIEDYEKIKGSNSSERGNPHCWAYIYPLGILEDQYYNGSERFNGVSVPIGREMI